MATIEPPVQEPPPEDWPHTQLLRRVRQAILSLPNHFQTETVLPGIPATDIHTLSGPLGAWIEDQVVETLNGIRTVWDPDEHYSEYAFVRQAQTFPDVLLRRPVIGPEDVDSPILMGIELKAWYVLAKEGEPNFRFKVTREACTRQDLLVIVPWALSQVISGEPRVFTPYLEFARYAADFRNYYWQHLRDTAEGTDVGIQSPEDVAPYPSKADNIQDRPNYDGGGNFGRIARTRMLDDYVDEILSRNLAGIQTQHWLSFFKAFTESRSEQQINERVTRLADEIRRQVGEDGGHTESVEQIIDGLRGIIELN